VIDLSPRQMVAMAMPHVHAITRTHFYDAPGTPILPAGVMWPVGHHGILAHCFHLHPIYVHPPRDMVATFGASIDTDLVPRTIESGGYIVTDSDEFCAFELTHTARDIGGIVREYPLTRHIAAWAKMRATERHQELFEHRIRIHDGAEAPEWAAVTAEADQVVGEVYRYLKEPEQPAEPAPPSAKIGGAFLSEQSKPSRRRWFEFWRRAG
jgi:hypothetical protein